MQDEQIKELIRSNRTALRLFIQLADAYRTDDPQLAGKEATAAMVGLLRLSSDTPDSHFGSAQWEPDPLAFAQFLDGIGDQSLGDFLGVENLDDIPGSSIEARADAIRDQSIEDKAEPPKPQLSSLSPRASNLHESFALRLISHFTQRAKQSRADTPEFQLGEAIGRADAARRSFPSRPDAGFDFDGIERGRFLDGYRKGSKL